MRSISQKIKFSYTISRHAQRIVAVILLISCNLMASAQTITKAKLLQITSQSDSSNKQYAAEKLYMQFDKPYYAIGDTIWFKAYLLNAAWLTPSTKSGVMYVDIANDSSKVIKQYRLAVQFGLTWGNISLDDKEFAAGTYTIRAYTNWMRNLGDANFFYKRFYISSAGENNLLVNAQVKTPVVNGGNTADVKLQFNDITKMPLADKPLQLQVMDGKKHLYKQKLRTDQNGFMDVNFSIPQKTSGLTLIAETDPKGKKAVIPIVLNRPENVDLQFLPEGGNLITGLPAHIGFKAIGEDGKGVDISGIIADHEQKQVATFQSLHHGMGSFNMAIKEGETYTAKVTMPGGAIKEYPLPAVKSSGTLLQIKNLAASDSVTVFAGATDDIAQSGGNYFLIGKARGIVCYAAIISFRDVNFIKRKIAKRLFPTGITHFTLINSSDQPLSERLVFIDHHDHLNIQFSTNRPAYGARDSIAIKLKVTDSEGKPVSGNFSLAVTDNAQVNTDTLNNENIISRFLLTSDLKGVIEEPGYYFSSKNADSWQALDNLLLTQGWIGYDWAEVFNPSKIRYEAEQDFMIKGSVTNVFNKPVAQTNVLLFSKKPSFLIDTFTNKQGRFLFKQLPAADTPVYVLQARNRNGKSFNVNVNIDEVTPPVFVNPSWPVLTPWYINSDSTLLNYNKSHALQQQLENSQTQGHVLKEVKITGKKIVNGSQNLNGPGNSDFVMDEKDIEKEGKKTLLQLFEQNIEGFREGTIRSVSHTPGVSGSSTNWYFVKDKMVILFIDGVDYIKTMRPTGIEDFTRYLQTHTAEDVKGLEVNFLNKYASAYEKRHPEYQLSLRKMSQFAFIEVTTRSGNGPGIFNTPGTYLYKPLPISWPNQFYKPKYTATDTAKHLPDLRSTIDWEPNITTGINGEANVFFYAADQPSTCTLIIEGTDINGNLGYKSGKINIKN